MSRTGCSSNLSGAVAGTCCSNTLLSTFNPLNWHAHRSYREGHQVSIHLPTDETCSPLLHGHCENVKSVSERLAPCHSLNRHSIVTTASVPAHPHPRLPRHAVPQHTRLPVRLSQPHQGLCDSQRHRPTGFFIFEVISVGAVWNSWAPVRK